MGVKRQNPIFYFLFCFYKYTVQIPSHAPAVFNTLASRDHDLVMRNNHKRKQEAPATNTTTTAPMWSTVQYHNGGTGIGSDSGGDCKVPLMKRRRPNIKTEDFWLAGTG